MHKLCVRSYHAQISDCSRLLAQSDADLLMYAWGEIQNRPVYTYTNGILISIHSSISPFSATNPGSGHKGSGLKREAQISLTSATSSRSSDGTMNRTQASQEMKSLQ